MKILAADGISAQGIEILKSDFEVDIRDKISHEELLEIIPQFDALMVRSASKVTADVIERAKNLKIIGRAGVGVDNIDVQAATSKGILVINSPGGNTIAATEHTCAMMLALARKIPIANQTMQAGEWNRKKYGRRIEWKNSRRYWNGTNRCWSCKTRYRFWNGSSRL